LWIKKFADVVGEIMRKYLKKFWSKIVQIILVKIVDFLYLFVLNVWNNQPKNPNFLENLVGTIDDNFTNFDIFISSFDYFISFDKTLIYVKTVNNAYKNFFFKF